MNNQTKFSVGVVWKKYQSKVYFTSELQSQDKYCLYMTTVEFNNLFIVSQLLILNAQVDSVTGGIGFDLYINRNKSHIAQFEDK